MSVLLLGDSHLAVFGSRPRLVGRACTVRAVGGAAAADLLDQLGDLEPGAFDAILVSVGTNDCGVRPAGLSDFVAAVSALVRRVQPTPVLMVNNPGADHRASQYDNDQMVRYAAAAAAVVLAAGGGVVDVPTVIRPLGLRGRSPDGIHVSKLGHLLVVPALRRGIRRLRRGRSDQTQRRA